MASAFIKPKFSQAPCRTLEVFSPNFYLSLPKNSDTPRPRYTSPPRQSRHLQAAPGEESSPQTINYQYRSNAFRSNRPRQPERPILSNSRQSPPANWQRNSRPRQ